MLLKNTRYWDSNQLNYRRATIRITDGKFEVSENETTNGLHPLNAKEETYDLSGYYLLPSLIDSHAHLIGIGLHLLSPSLSDVSSLSDLADIIRSTPAGTVILRGWDEEKLKETPDKYFIDRVDALRPVVLIRKCGHLACVNTKAIEEFNLKKSEGIDASEIYRGILKERAIGLLSEHLQRSDPLLRNALNAASELLISEGITSIHTDDLGCVPYARLKQLFLNSHHLRIYEKLLPEENGFFYEWMNRPGDFFGDFGEYLSIRCVKLLLDGSFGARTAYLNRSYEGDPGNRGVRYYNQEDLEEYIALCEKNGITLCIHVIGDGALESALRGFERKSPTDNPLRHRLIHVQMAHPEQIKRIKKQNLWVSIQPVFYDSDNLLAPVVLGEKRYREVAYPFKALFEEGIPIALSTDAPVERSNPWVNLAASTRFFPIKDAFMMYTSNAAKSGFSESVCGKIRTGFYADALLFDKNIFEIETNTLRDIKPVNVLFNGKWLYDIRNT
jgi:predicted amidohydrolase YtcJ